ncbi:MAG: glycosyltransferase [Candidatus Firestonebacteria bacterium]
MKTLLVISSYPPRFCGIATFVEEAIEFIKKERSDIKVDIISHLDGEGENVHPVIDVKNKNWYESVAKEIKNINPDVIHIQHEYGLYNYIDERGEIDNNLGFIKLLDLIKEYPTVIEAHTVHGRLKEKEEYFIEELLKRCTVLILKCDYQKWRLSWTFQDKINQLLQKVTVIPHGARLDRRVGDDEINKLKNELGFEELINRKIVGLVGWVQSNKRWDIVINMWKELEEIIFGRTKENWFLFAAGDMRDSAHHKDYIEWIEKLKKLEEKGIAKHYKFEPRGEKYYKIMEICDFIVLPSIDETQSGTLARVIATNTPYITTAPMEGLTSQTLESEGGLLFTNKESLRRSIITMASNEKLRRKLGDNLKWYLENKVNWELIAKQYFDVYEKAIEAKGSGKDVCFQAEF